MRVAIEPFAFTLETSKIDVMIDDNLEQHNYALLCLPIQRI